jgi:phosphoglycolate phosphatase
VNVSPKACFFDLDGTLIDSLADIADATNAALEAHGYPAHSYDDYRLLVGYGAKALFTHALPEGLTLERIEEIMPAMRKNYAEGWARKTSPYAGAQKMLDALEKKGVILGILSNKPHSLALKTVEHFFPATTFADVRGHIQNVPTKPDPTAVLDMAALLKVRPEEAFFIGDTRTDMETAVNAGMTPVGVTWGFRDADELRTYGAKILINHPEELLGYIH